MGIRITSTSWRTPLQLIDSWLPPPSQRCGPRPSPLGPMIQRFVRAGWLGRCADKEVRARNTTSTLAPRRTTTPSDTPPLKVVRPVKTLRRNALLVISGRMADVCAELDRLDALEHPTSNA